MENKYPHLLETTTTECTKRTYMIHPKYDYCDLTEEEKEIVYRSGVEWCEIYQRMFNDLYERVIEDFTILKEKGMESEEGKEIIDNWTN